MSSNPKQTATGGPQTQRFHTTYQPMSQTGGRPEGFPVTNPYVQTQGNQGANQGPGGIRGIPQPVPPSSTPPNVDLKVQTLQPQSSINPQLMFTQSVRPPQQYYPRSAAPATQNPRMGSHNNRAQQPLFHQPIYQVPQQQVFVPNYNYSAGNRQNFVQTVPVYPAPPFQFPYSATQTTQTVPYYYSMVPRTGTIQTPQPVTPNPAQQSIQIPMVQTNSQPHNSNFHKNNAKTRRPNAIKVIDPDTGLDRLDEVLGENSHPPSGESSARQTPQPPQAIPINKEVQATFAKQVLQAIGNNVETQQRLQDDDDHHHVHHPPTHSQMPPAHPPNSSSNNSNLHQPPVHPHLSQEGSDQHTFQAPPPILQQPPPPIHLHTQSHIESSQIIQYPPPNPQAQPAPPSAMITSSPAAVSSIVPTAESMDHIVKNSTFNAMAKEFVLPQSSSHINTAKETTPVVSANCDAAEVTLTPKLHKDRESPSKGRKLKDLHQKISISSVSSVGSSSVDQHQQPPPSERSSTSLSGEDKSSGDAKKQRESSNTLNTTNVPQVVSKDVIPEEVEPKKGQKKDKFEQKQEIFEIDSQSQQVPVITQENAKTKQNARNSSKQGGQQQQPNPHHQNSNQKSNATSVPQSQPPKTSNKSHKRIDLNQKGANKEGTDMDAFNDNSVKESKETVTATNASTYNDIHSNADIPNNASVGVISNNNNSSKIHITNEFNKKLVESNDTSPTNINNINTIKTTSVVPTPPPTVTASKPKANKVDVTSIVREQPKVTKLLQPTATTTAANNSTDETDRSVVTGVDVLNANNNKFSKIGHDQTPNNTSNKIISENNNKLPYQEGQWTPSNQDGFKVYQKDFLMALRDSPSSKIKPEKILEMVALDDRGRLGDGRASMGGRADFTPPFNSYGGGGKSGSQRGNGPKRNSSQSKQGMGGGSKSVKAPQAKVSISLREDVKLHEAENAWRPARFNVGDNATDEDRKTELLYKKVRGILNKLTPQKFDTLLGKIKDLQIDNPERLQGVIDLVFDKAVDEPNFSVAYARMCKELALMHVKTTNSTPDKVEIVNFRKILITRCQMEFEKQSVDESTRNTKLKEIEECTDPDKKKDLQFDLEEHDRKLRMKSVGNVRFIGELFKQDMLTVNIMVRCLHNLLENKDEESLECLCKLLTTIGKELETTKGVDLSPILNTMKSITDKKDGKISSRIRFMLQDVIDLRAAKWVPRRQDLNPKTIDQIQKEAEREQLNIQMMNAAPITPRKDDRMGGGGGMSLDRKSSRGGRNVTEDGWTVSNQRNRSNNQIFVQTDKFKSKAHLIDEPFGSIQSFQTWGKGSQGTKSSSQIANTSNKYSALDNNLVDDKRMGGSNRSKDTYSSKGPSLDRSYNKFDGLGSRSGSQHRSSNDSSNSSSQRSTPAPMYPQMPIVGGASSNILGPSKMGAPPTTASVNTSNITAPSPPSALPTMSEEQMERSINNSIDEYVSGNAKINEYYQAISSCIPSTYFSKVVMISYLRVFEKSQNDRLTTGALFAKLVKQGQIHTVDYCAGLEEILTQAEDLKIDIPKFWDYLAEILVDIVSEEALNLDRLLDLSKKLIGQSDINKLLGCLFKLIASKKGADVLLQLWQRSGLNFTDFLDISQVPTFVKDNHLEFLLEGSAPASKKEQLSFEEIQNHLSSLLRKKASHDEIFDWITVNVGDGVKENKFIRALATAIFEDSISPNFKLQKQTLTNHSNLLLKYIDNNSNYELEGLYALQALIHKLEHPQGLLLEICTTLLDSLMFSHESFVAWEESNDASEQEGKGVALKQLTAFICQLKENDDDEDESSAEEA